MDNNNSLLKNRKKRLLILAGIILIVVVLPLTIYLVKQQQEQRGRAAEPDKLEAEGGTLSADGVIIQSDTLASGGKHIVFVDVTPSPDLTPSPTPPSGQVSAFIESGGSVVMETENNDGKFNRNGYRWDGAAPGSPQTATDGWHGDGY
ncbi:MAG: hypothetical protein HYW63_01300, partial [Candidatus Levybacteria bacterium]|nr:hypothetical protein [Candidatus Levybacteria bacterium]